VQDVIAGVLMPFMTLAMETLTISGILVLLVYVEPAVSVTAFIVLGGATTLFVRLMRGRLLTFAERMQVERGSMIQVVNEGLGAIKITKVLRREPYFLDRFAHASREYGRATRVRQVAQEIPRLFLEITAITGILGIAVVFLSAHRSPRDIIPVLSLMGVAIVRMVPSFNRVTSSLTVMRYGRQAIEVVYADLRLLESEEPRSVPVRAVGPVESPTHAIELDRVSYEYPASARKALDQVSLTVRHGETVALVGATGAGKTTMVDMILGLLEPSAGRIVVEGEAASSESATRTHVAYVPQEIYLTDDTIRRNIAFGHDDDTIDLVRLTQAVREAQLEEFIAGLPKGLDTEVGERGVRLSGGQRQRIGIARALYVNPEILILDEATSALDGETEANVMEAITFLRGRRTMVVVAHRMSTVRGCDRIVMIGDGRVLATGTYEELMAGEARFRRLSGVR
jgi:ABC-type multidrug transport system fused ATPase/permease subunit